MEIVPSFREQPALLYNIFFLEMATLNKIKVFLTIQTILRTILYTQAGFFQMEKDNSKIFKGAS